MADEVVNAGCSARWRLLIKDETGQGIDASALDSLKLTFKDRETGGIINSRTAQDVLNKNGVVASAVKTDADGKMYNVVFSMAPADNPTITAGKKLEAHVAVWTATWLGGAKAAVVDFTIYVRMLP